MLQKVTAGLQADNYPDIAYIYGSDLANLAGGEQLLDLTEAIDNGDIDWDRFVEAGKAAVTVDDRPRAVPAFIDNLAVVYNKKIFDDAGVDYPTDDWTWDDFLATAAELNDPDAGHRRLRLARDRRRGHDLADLAADLAAGRRDRHARTARASASTARSGEAALDVVAQAAADGSVYIDSTAGSERMQQLFASGKMAMNVAGPYTLPEYVDAKVDYGVVSMPSFGDEHTTIAGPDTWAIFDNGDERSAAAIEFLDWFSEPEQQLRWITEAGQPAADHRRRGGRRLRRLRAEPAGPRQVHREHRAGADPGRRSPSTRRSRRRSGKAIASVLYGEAEPSEALSQAVETSNAELQVPGP